MNYKQALQPITQPSSAKRDLRLIVLGWFITLLSTATTFLLVEHFSLNWVSSNFAIVFTAALSMWVFRLVPESIPALLVILSTLVLNHDPDKIILSGFRSDGFFLTLSLFAIGAVLVKSRLFYRLSLLILYYIPAKSGALQKALFYMGALMTPIITVQSSRVALIAPLMDDILRSSKIVPRSNTANALASAAFNGCILLSTIFLTGKSSNYILYAMLNEQGPGHLSWFDWLLAASFPGALLIAAYFLIQKLFFKHDQQMSINRFGLKKDLLTLGKLSFNERAALIAIATFILSLIFTSIEKISAIWISVAVFSVLFFSGVMSRNEFKTKINWTFLLYLGSIIGIMRYIQTIGIDLWLADNLSWLTIFTQDNILIFISSIYLISWLSSFILGTMTAPALLFTVLLPIAKSTGVNSWLVAFVILMATEAWIFPYQSTYFLCFEDLLKKKKNFQLTPLLRFNALFSLVKLIILLASVPFWSWLGIISH